ncbi:DUF7560 family zinc ribbon protein [Haloplanus pelagicus]|jgi:endogenous inhibitor of DNA gyrase (YacG/DUF329 family)|uniref:DUF7560 family zinc ribbon protein n=1 Tax=Haloplanus pelagicus TaxID=2949995 RepID=UPI00203ED255|nr:hypothetical protein [Haloplanus sp. HW8-1]
MNGGTDLTFHCPTCDESMDVNAPMREALLEHGCVVCGTTVPRSAFSSASSPGADGDGEA